MIIQTKFGNASIKGNREGYYQITTTKEGNYKKYLHILIWEDWYGISVPKRYVIHHIDNNKINNKIYNLQCITKENHDKYHGLKKKSIPLTKEHRKKLSENHANVSKEKNPFYGKTHSIDSIKKNSKNAIHRKLEEKDVILIRKLLKNTNLTQREIAKQFNTSRRNISSINTRRSWKHI
jgi:hypothetical protein